VIPALMRQPTPEIILDGFLTRAIIFLIIPVTTLAPSFGTAGTTIRFALAAAVAIVVLRRPICLPAAQVVLLTTFVLILIALAAGAPSLGYGVTRLLNWVMFLPLLFIGAAPERLRLIAKSLIFTCCIHMSGVLLQLTGHLGATWGGLLTSGSHYDPSQQNQLTRYTGFLGNPNDLGLLLSLGAMVCVLTVAMAVSTRKTVLLAMAGVFIWGVFLTGSRGAILGLVVGMLASLIFLGMRQRLIVSIVSILGVWLLLTQGGAFGLVTDSIGSIVAGQDASASFRSNLWTDRVSANGPWLFGSGFGGYAGNTLKGTGGLGVDAAVQQSMTIDNGWLKLFLEGGVLAVAVLTLLLISILVPLLAKHIRAGPNALAVGTAFCCMAMILWRSLSTDLLDINPWNAIIWLSAGIAVDLASSPRNCLRLRHREYVATDSQPRRQGLVGGDRNDG
jgi:hypothetical protein